MRISEINIYPVKSLKGISLRASVVEDRGLKDDRRFMVIGSDNAFLTQREFAKMATLKVCLGDKRLGISIENGDEMFVPFDFEDAEKIEVRVWDSYSDALVAGDGINRWLSDFLETECRLVNMPVSTRRPINGKFNSGDDIVSFADGYPILLIGETSLEDLNSKLKKKIQMNRFRPNLVVSGSDAFAEDGWKKLRIGSTILRATKPCVRCVITTIDQDTGIPDIKEPLKTLATFRKSSDVFPDALEAFGLGKNDILFGQNLVAENFGNLIRVGDKVEIIE